MVTETISEKVARYLNMFADSGLAERYRTRLIIPRTDEKVWECDQKEEKYLAWIIAEFEGYDVAVAYTENSCEHSGLFFYSRFQRRWHGKSFV